MTSRRLRTTEEERGVGDELVEGDVRVEGHVEVDEGAAQQRDAVAAHGEQQEREGEADGGRRATRQADAVARDAAVAAVFSQVRVICGTR